MTQEEKLDALKQVFISRGWIDVMKPALQAAIASAEEEWLTGARAVGREKVTDDMLRGQIIGLKWVLGQERAAKALVEQLEQIAQLQRETEPAKEGGSPYE